MPHRWEEIAQAIQTSIDNGELQVGDRLPSEKQLALQWQVARMTVHRALSDLHLRGLVTRRRRLGTVVAEARPQRQITVGLLFFHTNDFPQVDYIHGIRAGLPDAVNLLFCDTRNDVLCEISYLQRMQTQVDAILCYPTCDPKSTPLLHQTLAANIPLICVDRIPEGVTSDGIVTDNFGSAAKALRLLTDQGHQRIGFLGYNEMEVSSARERYTAYLHIMSELGCHDASRWTRTFPKGTGYDFLELVQIVHDALFTLCRQSEAATAVFCEDDYIMAAVLEACERQALHVPSDLAILSFNDCPSFPHQTRGVNRLIQQAHTMGRMAAERLHRRLVGEALPPEVIRVPALFYPAVASPVLPFSSIPPVFDQSKEMNNA